MPAYINSKRLTRFHKVMVNKLKWKLGKTRKAVLPNFQNDHKVRIEEK